MEIGIYGNQKAVERRIGQLQKQAAKIDLAPFGVHPPRRLEHGAAGAVFEIVGRNLADHQLRRLRHADEDLEHFPIPGGEAGRSNRVESLDAGLAVPVGRWHAGGEV